MAQNIFQTDPDTLKNYLNLIIKSQIGDKAKNWLDLQIPKLENEYSNKTLYLSFSSAPRFVGKNKLELTPRLIEDANKLRKEFNPSSWSIDRATRSYLLLFIPAENKEQYLKTIETLFSTADVDEQVALYGALPLLPYPEDLSGRMAEGIRTNIAPVLEAIVLNNPYPAEYLSDDAWNQMVLKGVFTEKPLYKISQADQRSNPNLARMLSDFAHERWAAHRMVTPELWRFVAPFLNENHLKDIQQLMKEGTEFEKEAGALALHQSDFPEGKNFLAQFPELRSRIEKGELSWDSLGMKYNAVN